MRDVDVAGLSISISEDGDKGFSNLLFEGGVFGGG